MINYTALSYLKGLILWDLATDNNAHLSSISNNLFSIDKLSNKKQGLKKILGDKINGYRIYRKPGAYIEDFCLEKGVWAAEDYLHDWTYFAVFCQLDFSKTASRLIRAIFYYIQENNVGIDALLYELWEEYWIIDINLYAIIRKALVYGDYAPSLEDVEVLYNEVLCKISNAKNDSHNLDEWIVYLHHIIPSVVFGNVISDFDDEEIKKYNRYFEEVKADILETLSMCLLGTLINDDKFFSRQYLPADEKEEAAYQRSLRYICNSRVIVPKFWYNLAKDCFDNYIALLLLSEKLNTFDEYALVGICCHISIFHVQHMLEYLDTGKMSYSENEHIYINE